MKWLIIGLGNPGERYNNTRHNAGFLVVDEWTRKHKVEWNEAKKLDGQLAETAGWKALKPETFMNASGESVQKAVHYFKIPADHVIVVHDDLDLPLGSAKVGWAKGPHIHNGILSVETTLGTKEFWRVRMGVDNRAAEERRMIRGEQYVLKPLEYAERKVLEVGIEKGLLIIKRIMEGEYAISG